MWCFYSQLTIGKSWKTIAGRGWKPTHSRDRFKSRSRPSQFSYSSVPLHTKKDNIRTEPEGHSSDISPSPKSIRLLKILPTRSDGLLECRLEAVELDSGRTPSYDALSYTWGHPTQANYDDDKDAKRDHLIICNNMIIFLRESHCDKFLWIDAICINQDDPDERAEQVSIMADIYRSAKGVVIWLGPSDEFTQPAWELITSLSQLSETERKSVSPEAFNDAQNTDLLGRANSREHWRALVRLFGRRWFTRAWVVQELVLARDTTILCGEYVFDWQDIVTVSDFMARRTSSNAFKAHISSHESETTLSYKNPAKLAAIKKDTIDGTKDVLLYSLIRCRTYDAKNSHDKVYSLLGLAGHQGNGSSKLFPNYKSSVAKVYTDVAEYILENSRDLHILAHAEGDKFRKTVDLPTWAPDWSVKKDLGLKITGYARYQAAGELPCFKELRGEGVLALRGFELDTISRVGETKENVNQTKDCSNWLELLSELEHEYPVRDHRDAFWRTLLIDTDPSKTVPVKSSWEDSFYVWMNLCDHEPSEEDKQRAADFETSFTHSLNLRLFRTARGHLGCGTLSCREGDLVWIIQGSRVPLILRPLQQEESTAYNLVGGTYLHGFMQGEAFKGQLYREIVLV
ncbi:HET-domain-containing protein [Hypomontagnella submonticulosa]|nr:HET-domain-containing protein [Hypomontagnella submonticulosa]